MKCEMVDELIQHYLDLSLSHEQRIQLERHVELCSRCREELQSYKRLVELFEEEDSCPELPADFTQMVMSSLPDISFQNSSTKGFGSGFESIAPYLKYAGMAVAAVFVVSITQLDLPFHFPWDKNTGPGPVMSVRVDAGGEIDQSFHGLGGDGMSGDSSHHQIGDGEFPLRLEVSGGVVHVRSSSGFQIIKNGEIHSLAFLDEVRTGAQATASIVYPEDKVRLRLKSRTRVQIARNSLRLFHGNSWVHIVRKGTKFEVKTPNLIAAVRGTVFSVEVEGDSVSTGTRGPLTTRSVVSVFEGQVEVRSLTSNQPAVFVNPSQEVESKGLILTEVSELEQDARDKWGEALRDLDLPTGREGHPDTSTLPKNSEVRPEESFSDELDR